MKRVLVSNGNPMETVVGFCRAVRVGPYISVGGTAPVDSKGNTVGIGDPAAQARRCLEIIKEALENAGAGMEGVVRTRFINPEWLVEFEADAIVSYGSTPNVVGP